MALGQYGLVANILQIGTAGEIEREAAGLEKVQERASAVNEERVRFDAHAAETVETKRRPVPASGVEDWPEESSSTTTRVIIDCAVARCFSMSASGMVVRPVSMRRP